MCAAQYCEMRSVTSSWVQYLLFAPLTSYRCLVKIARSVQSPPFKIAGPQIFYGWLVRVFRTLNSAILANSTFCVFSLSGTDLNPRRFRRREGIPNTWSHLEELVEKWQNVATRSGIIRNSTWRTLDWNSMIRVQRVGLACLIMWDVRNRPPQLRHLGERSQS